MKQNYLNLEVFNKRDGTRGTVVGQDGSTVTIKAGDTLKSVTESTFSRWYTIVPQDKNSESGEDVSEKSSLENLTVKKPERKSLPAGEPEVGKALREKFLHLVKDQATQELDITYNDKSKCDTIKYNGRNVFECTSAKRRFTVMCHPLSLTADNLRRADRVFPKDWGWSLRAKFIFTDINQWSLTKTIIADGLFYRHKEE